MAWAVVLGVSLAGCASVDRSREPKAPEVEGAWRAPAPGLAASWGAVEAGSKGWWRGFDDEGLSSFVGVVLERNKGLEASVAAARAAEAMNKAAEASVFPQVGLAASQTRQRQESGSGSASLRYSTLGASLAWEAPLYGQVELARSSKKAADAVEAYGLEAARAGLAYQAAKAYLSFKLAAQARLCHAVLVRSGELELKAAREARAAGLASDRSVELAMAQLSGDQSGAERALADESQAKEAMRALAGGAWMGGWEASERTPVFQSSIALSLPADAARARPDVRSAEAAAWLALNAESSARSESLPKLALQGVIQIALSGALPGAPARSVVSAITPSVGMPLWDWGMAEAKKQRASFALDQALARYQESVIQAVGEMEGALIEAHRARLGREQAQERLRLSAKQQERSALDFKAGLIAPVEAWQSARALARERLASAQAAHAEGVAVAYLHKAMARSEP